MAAERPPSSSSSLAAPIRDAGIPTWRLTGGAACPRRSTPGLYRGSGSAARAAGRRALRRMLAERTYSKRALFLSILVGYGPARSIEIISGSSQSCIVTVDFPLALPAGISTTASHPPSEARRIQATCRARIEVRTGGQRSSPTAAAHLASHGRRPERLVIDQRSRHAPRDRALDIRDLAATDRT
jgi:hypothetical protein